MIVMIIILMVVEMSARRAKKMKNTDEIRYFLHVFPSYDDHNMVFFAPAARFPKSKILKIFVLV